MAAPAKALRAALKEAAGKLLSQLYDRNCRRQFVPLEAFQTDSLPPERFRVEMQTAAAAAGGLMQATNTRVWGLLRSVHFSLASTFCDCQVWTPESLTGIPRCAHKFVAAHVCEPLSGRLYNGLQLWVSPRFHLKRHF